VINVKNRKGSIRCREGEILVEVISEKGTSMVQDFRCIEPGEARPFMARACVPNEDSKYVTCQSHECPDGYYIAGIHVEDDESGRSGFGFSCISEREEASPRVALWAMTGSIF
jgi:hypothetical protein